MDRLITAAALLLFSAAACSGPREALAQADDAATRGPTANDAASVIADANGKQPLVSDSGLIRIIEVDAFPFDDPSSESGARPGREGSPEPVEPVLVPAYLPDGMVLTRSEVPSGRSPFHLYKGEGSILVVKQATVMAEPRVKPGSTEAVHVGDMPGFLIKGVWKSIDGSPLRWDPDAAISLVFEIGNGYIRLSASGISREELFAIAESLAPDGAGRSTYEKQPYPRETLDELGPAFGSLYVPSYLPEGYSLQGNLEIGPEIPRGSKTTLLKYRSLCEILLIQYANEVTPPAIAMMEKELPLDVEARKPRHLSVEGVELYARERAIGYSSYWFQRDRVWFEIMADTRELCGLDVEEVARVAKSIGPLTD